MSPEMLIVAGANGSGKSTFAGDFVRKSGWEYLGADALAAELAGGGTPSTEVQVQAGRRFFKEFDRLLLSRTSFVVETILSGLGFRRMIHDAQTAGFKVTICFFYLESAELCIARVAERVRKGGHQVPDQDVRRRFQRSFSNFWNIYRKMAEGWVVMYNGGIGTFEVVFGERQVFVIGDSNRFDRFLRLVDGEPL